MTSVPVDILYHRAKYILRNEGLWAFVRQGLSFVGNLFLGYGNYYVYEKALSPADEEVRFKPRIDCTLRVISSPDALDELIAQAYDFKAMNFRPKLEKGALAFCLFVGQELASVTWVAPSKEAKQEVDYLPFNVDFRGGEVCSGASFTDHIFRGKGLFSYTYSHIFSHLARSGVSKDKFTIEVNNTASQRALAKFNPLKSGKGHYLRILSLQFWKEQPVAEIEQ